jgi:hypothetical protein
LCISFLFAANIAAAAPEGIKGHWSEKEILEYADIGILEIFRDEAFMPEKPITRGEFVRLVNRIFNYSGTIEVPFSDICTDSLYASDIKTAAAVGYIRGCADGTFKPDNHITRQEVAVMLSRILGLDISLEDVLDRFKDKDEMPQWSRGSINAMSGSGYMKGWGGYFKPCQAASRAEVLVVLNRIIDRKTESFEIRPEVVPLK